jgi:hypothetical protein
MTRSGSCRIEFEAKGLTNATLIAHQTRLKRHANKTPVAIQPPDRQAQLR